MSFLAQQPSSIAKVLDTSFKLYVASFKNVIGFGLIIAALYILLGVFTQQMIPEQIETAETAEMMLMESLPLMIASIFIITIASFILYAAIIYRIDNVSKQRTDSFREALALGLKKFPAMLWAIILYSIAIMVGSMLLVIPGIILMLSLGFYSFFIVIENTSGFASLTSSHRLVWGNWWRTMTVFMVPGILLMILFFVFGLVAAFSGDIESDTGWLDILMNLTTALYMPYFYVLGYVQYHDLKLRTSGSDLEARMLE